MGCPECSCHARQHWLRSAGTRSALFTEVNAHAWTVIRKGLAGMGAVEMDNPILVRRLTYDLVAALETAMHRSA